MSIVPDSVLDGEMAELLTRNHYVITVRIWVEVRIMTLVSQTQKRRLSFENRPAPARQRYSSTHQNFEPLEFHHGITVPLFFI